MGMTEEEKFLFDLNGYLVRPSVLARAEIDAIVDQLDRIHHDPQSLPVHQRDVPSGPSAITIDHPAVLEVLHEVIGPNLHIEVVSGVWRHRGQGFFDLHMGGPMKTDPIFGYRYADGKIYAGMVRVVFELTDIAEDDCATWFLPGSHKSNFPIHAKHHSFNKPNRSPYLRGYSCPAGSVLFFSENTCHGAPLWNRDTPRISIFLAYSHVATCHQRPMIRKEVLEGLTREQQAYFRDTWNQDFTRQNGPMNSVDAFLESGDEARWQGDNVRKQNTE